MNTPAALDDYLLDLLGDAAAPPASRSVPPVVAVVTTDAVAPDTDAAAAEPALAAWLAKAGMAHERRILRLPIAGLTGHYPELEIVQLQFVLPAGCFATAVVRELVDLLPAGQTDSPCEF